MAAASAAPAAVLARLGIELSEEAEAAEPYVLKGATFAVRDHIREAGGRWHRREQAWRLCTADQLAALARRLEERAPAKGLAEAPSEFAYGSKHYHGHRERLRTRFLEGGPEPMPDYELLELLLFFSVWRRDTKPVAKELLNTFGSLGGVLAADPGRYAEIVAKGRSSEEGKGQDEEDVRFTTVLLKAVQAVMERVLREEISERPLLTSWTALIDYLRMTMMHETAEHFRLLFLDRKNILIRDEVQSRGTVDHTPLYPREVVKRALELAASALIMVHNHPSGDPTPSRADIEMTRQVIQALEAVNITVHDHVIIGKKDHLSFRSQGLI